ncbi:SIR2 family protein [Romboutsia sedimentorum]|uniref:SIR2 family protein n=1 Tax=Romboutsia sedimentorum TaxID=1368474 RepID=UPI0024DEC2D2|nr:SIR2 family protein [Romboutsia sedimentorum]MDK2585331.1 SIR2 family protein [Romboutsia sedimentorum]
MKAFIEESKDIICKASRNNKLAVFVGAGVSMNSGYPSWSSLISDFAKGVGIDMDKCSYDDYLKIPQYYYNLRKEKDYYDVILNKFSIKGDPNKIHDLIIDLDPAHIITTNYDDLIERASNKRGLFFDVVAKDTDLPYSINNKMIIKMHGDLNNKNIVLKEDDYLSYFENFKLIQNYIKSLISTHIVLFVGYSISDVNVKYIFQWVKDILKNDFQQVYFIEADENKKINQLEFEYYRNRGINILYTSECKEIDYFKQEFNYGNLDNDKAKSIIKFLYYLTDENSNEKLTVNIAYEKLKPLNTLNMVSVEDIRISLGLQIPWKDEKSIYYTYYKLENYVLKVHNEKLKDLFKELSEYRLDNKGNEIQRILFNARIRTVVDENEQIILNIDFKENENLNKDIYFFNYEKLVDNTRFNVYQDIRGQEKEQLDVAYSLYNLGKYYEAYILLKRISESCIENKLYYLYFISEFNRYHLGRNISYNPFNIKKLGIDLEIQEQIQKEVRKIDLNNIYLKLPKSDMGNIEVYRDILAFKFIHRKTGDVLSLEKKIKEEKDTIFYGGSEENSSIYKLREDMKYFSKFITSNRLFINNYIEVRMSFYKFIDNMLFSYSIEDKNIEDKFMGMSCKRFKIDKIDYFTIYSMINYLSIKEIKELFNKYNIDKLIIEEDAIDKLKDLNYNLAYSLNNIETIVDIKERYCKFLYIIFRSKLDSKEFDFSLIIKYFIDTLESNKKILTREIITEISTGVIAQSKISKAFLDNDMIKMLLEKLFISIKDTTNNSDNVVSSIEICILNIIYLIDKNDINISEFEEKLIVEYVKFNKNKQHYYYKILVKSCSIVSDQNKNMIIKQIKTILENKDDFSYDEFLLYKLSMYYEIINPDIILERKLIDFIDSEIYKRESEKKRGMYCGRMYDVDDLLMDIFYLLAYSKILNTNEVVKYSQINGYIKFILEDINTEIFNVEWIIDFPTELNKKLANNEEIKKKIEKYISTNLNKKDIIEIYFRDYC